MMKRVATGLLLMSMIASGCGSSEGTTQQTDAAEQPVATDSGSERDDAIAKLAAEAFLPERAAECIVDTVFFETGGYDMTSEVAQSSMDTDALIERCTDLAVAGVGTVELTADMAPSVRPGGLATGTVTLDGTAIDYVTITPAGFEAGDLAPVFLAFPPGGQDLAITQNVAESVYLQQAVARGWVVVSPASPDGLWFDQDKVGLAPALADWVAQWVTIEGGKPHLGGMSNGGLTAFNVIAQNPDGYRSLLAYPGFARDGDQAVLQELGDIPVRLWVGSLDTGWVDAMESATEQMRGAGADVILTVLPGEPHIITSIADGTLIFEQLEAAR